MSGQEAIIALTIIREQRQYGPIACPHPAEALDRDELLCAWECTECWTIAYDEHVADRMSVEGVR